MPTAPLIICLAVNIVTIVLGLILLITASLFLSNIDYIQDICPSIYILLILSVVIGVLTMVFASGLTVWILKQFPLLSTIFSGLLNCVILLATICGIILLITRSNLQTTTLNKTTIIFNNYSDSNNTLTSNAIISQIQQSFECCGIQAATDWKNRTSGDGTSTPDSCCIVMTPYCGKHTLIKKNGIYLDGCADSLYHHFKRIFTTLIGMNFSIAIIASASCITFLYLKQYMKRRYESF